MFFSGPLERVFIYKFVMLDDANCQKYLINCSLELKN